MPEQTSLIAPGLGAMVIPIDSVTPHPRNSNRGDVARIRASLAAHGQYTPITIQASTSLIMKGNHTWKAAKELGWTHIAAIAEDCEDEEALAILEVDNATSDTKEYDEAQRKANWEVIAEYREAVRDGRRKPKLAPADQQELDLLVADELERLSGLSEVETPPSQADFSESSEDYARRAEKAAEDAGGDAEAAIDQTTLAKAVGFREVILMFQQEDYSQFMYLSELVRKSDLSIASHSAAVLRALRYWTQNERPDEWKSLDDGDAEDLTRSQKLELADNEATYEQVTYARTDADDAAYYQEHKDDEDEWGGLEEFEGGE